MKTRTYELHRMFTLRPGDAYPLLYRVAETSSWLRLVLSPTEGMRVRLRLDGKALPGCKNDDLDAALFSAVAVHGPDSKLAPVFAGSLIEVLVYYPLKAARGDLEFQAMLSFAAVPAAQQEVE